MRMPTLFERLAAKVAYIHARRVQATFRRALDDVDAAERRVLAGVCALTADSDFGRQHDLRRVRTPADLRRAVPLMTYEDYRPYIDRLSAGETTALFRAGQRILMFATSSGTTAAPKHVPVTPEFVRDYRRGWNVFGLKMLSDHPRAILRHILQSSGRPDESRTSAGIPCGAITGLLARTQKRIVRRFYVGCPEIANLDDAQARYYTLMRLGITHDVAFAITANPATLIQMAKVADERGEELIRDVHDGTLSSSVVQDAAVRDVLAARLRPEPARASELTRLRAAHGQLRPRDYWRLEFLACWTGGSLAHYLQRLRDWWGPLPVRDVGLLASEGRVSLPLDDNAPIGVLDVTTGVFEFIPAEQTEAANPETLPARALETGRDYAVVLTNRSGLMRYRLDDVVRVHGWLGQAPLIEFLYRAGRVSSVAGEKLTENQAVAAIRLVAAELGLPEFDFVLTPQWEDPPYYRLFCATPARPDLAAAVDMALAKQNAEYASRRKSQRLGVLRSETLAPETLAAFDRLLLARRRSTAEQYKRPCLLTNPSGLEQMLSCKADTTNQAPTGVDS
jgi:hypothetical protein